MVNYMVAIDDSNYSRAAFYTAVYMMNKETDHIFLICIVERLKTTYPVGYIPPSVQNMIEAQTKNAVRSCLLSYAKLCRMMKLKYSCILGVSNHVGEMICQQVVARQIDMLVVGRRGASGIARWLMGSVSRYLLEHSACNVLVVKGEWGPAEIHSNKQAVIQMEEKERQRRIEQENQEKAQEAAKQKFESELDRNIAILAEETERMARIREEEEAKEREMENRKAAHIGAVIDEEEERKRRIKEQEIVDDRTHRVEIFEHEF